jgi:hypothetical protein
MNWNSTKKNPMKLSFEESLVSTIWNGCQERMKNSKFLSSPLIDNFLSPSLSLSLSCCPKTSLKLFRLSFPPLWSGCHQRLKNMSFFVVTSHWQFCFPLSLKPKILLQPSDFSPSLEWLSLCHQRMESSSFCHHSLIIVFFARSEP